MKLVRTLLVVTVLAFFYAQVIFALTAGITAAGVITTSLAAVALASLRPCLLERLIGWLARPLFVAVLVALFVGFVCLAAVYGISLPDLAVAGLIGATLLVDERVLRASVAPVASPVSA